MTRPVDEKLYELVKKLSDVKFKEKTSIYKSSWIVNEYKKRGGKYAGEKPKKSGLTRWYVEKWIDLNRPIKDSSGKIIDYRSCGRPIPRENDVYPLCRPSKRITKQTPKTYSEIPIDVIKKANKQKQKLREKGSIKFK